MVIYNIRNFEPLFDTLERCPEGASIVMRDGRRYDWRTNRELLRSLLASVDGACCSRLEVRAGGKAGEALLINYLMSKDRASVFAKRPA
jgi:hypothetical protein